MIFPPWLITIQSNFKYVRWINYINYFWVGGLCLLLRLNLLELSLHENQLFWNPQFFPFAYSFFGKKPIIRLGKIIERIWRIPKTLPLSRSHLYLNPRKFHLTWVACLLCSPNYLQDNRAWKIKSVITNLKPYM